jgi:chemotaxis protein CheD
MKDTGSSVVRVMMAEYRIMKTPARMMTMALGSCLGIVLYDGRAGVGALAHVMHPSWKKVKNNSNKGKFVDTAIEVMISEMSEAGGDPNRIAAKLFGGATMFDSRPNCRGVIQIGALNIRAAREVLGSKGIPVVSESVGGSRGRTIMFDLSDGSVLVRDITGKEKVM